MTPKQKSDKLAEKANKLYKNYILIAEEEGGKVFGSYGGSKFDVGKLINIVAVACDDKKTREILYLAVKLDIEHNIEVGRHTDL